MNSQDFRNLQEAYMDVYELDEMFGLGKKKGKSPRADAIINSPEFKKRMEDADKIAVQNLKDMMSGDKKRQNRVAMHPDNRTDLNDYKEEVDLYDIILSHLLDEGYAETVEAAESIMVNMSEDWRESICEGMKPLPVGRMMRQAIRKGKKLSGYENTSDKSQKVYPKHLQAKELRGQDVKYPTVGEYQEKMKRQIDKMITIADTHNEKQAKRKEDDNRREGGRKRDAGRPRSNELQDNW
jgi:galactitol-specific phosphotransferase system IIB component